MSQTQNRQGLWGSEGGTDGKTAQCFGPAQPGSKTCLLYVTDCCPLQSLSAGSPSQPEEDTAQYELAVEGPTWNDPSDWDPDTQKDWERFMRGSKSREASTPYYVIQHLWSSSIVNMHPVWQWGRWCVKCTAWTALHAASSCCLLVSG